MKKYILYLLLTCLATVGGKAQRLSEIIFDIKSTFREFSSDLNNINTDIELFEKRKKIFKLYGPQIEPRVFMYNGVRTGSITKWVETYVTDSLQSVPVSHTFDISENTVKKVSTDPNDQRYSFEALMKREYVDFDGNIITSENNVSFTVIWTRKDSWVEIAEINGAWPAIHLPKKETPVIADEQRLDDKLDNTVIIYAIFAHEGDSGSQFNLGYCYEYGLYGLDIDLVEAAKWYRKAARKRQASAQNRLGLFYEKGLGGLIKDTKEAFKWYRKAAKKGHAEAQYHLGRCYDLGKGVPKNLVEAAKWYRKSAELGFADAQYKLASYYCFGYGGHQIDYQQAVHWWQQAAEQGHAKAQFNLGLCYNEGLVGLDENLIEAANWYSKSANQGEAKAQYKLGVFYYWGSGGLPKDIKQAVHWWQQAVEQGHAKAMYELHVCYDNGEFVPKDIPKANKLLKESAEKGYDVAQYQLGLCYEHGISVTKNIDEAIKWYRKSAEQGNEDAIKRLKELDMN